MAGLMASTLMGSGVLKSRGNPFDSPQWSPLQDAHAATCMRRHTLRVTRRGVAPQNSQGGGRPFR